MRPPEGPGGSLTLSRVQAARQGELLARAYFGSLFAGTGAYREAHVARYDDRLWPRVDIHSSTARTIYVMRRARP